MNIIEETYRDSSREEKRQSLEYIIGEEKERIAAETLAKILNISNEEASETLNFEYSWTYSRSTYLNWFAENNTIRPAFLRPTAFGLLFLTKNEPTD